MDKCKHHGIIRVVYAISLGRIFFCPYWLISRKKGINREER
nr:MAG TPA: hypothetical protein [Caudoviricetes sp.]